MGVAVRQAAVGLGQGASAPPAPPSGRRDVTKCSKSEGGLRRGHVFGRES